MSIPVYILSNSFDENHVKINGIMDKTSFSDWLLEQLRERKWSQAQLARASGLTPQAISNYINRNVQKPDEDALAALARGLKLPVQTVYRAAGMYLPSQSNFDEETEQMVHIFEQLTEEDQEAVLGLAHFLVSRRTAKGRTRPAEG